ncbi:hypothetical protein IG631_13540 [Alternaria alternata]|nr:hypothetical protein IG631_13540 [Alternaria alternata]
MRSRGSTNKSIVPPVSDSRSGYCAVLSRFVRRHTYSHSFLSPHSATALRVVVK